MDEIGSVVASLDAILYLAKWVLIGMGFFCMGVSAVVVFRFMSYWYQGRAGLMPLHVWLVALSYDLLLGLAITSRINGLGESWWRWSVYTVAVIIGFAAMVVVSRVQYKITRGPNHKKDRHA